MDKFRTLIVCACLLALVGCKAKSGIVGEWVGTQPSPIGGATDVTVKFNADGTFVRTTGSGPLSGETDGTYTYDDASKQLTMNQQKITIGGQEVKVTGGALPQGQPTSVTWTGSDQMTVKMALGDISLKRK
ncbi:MAG: lipocalin-like domain-containing protein [Fimbriimonadales bacterium]